MLRRLLGVVEQQSHNILEGMYVLYYVSPAREIRT